MHAPSSTSISPLQRLCVLLAAACAVGASVLQATGLLGLTPAEFADTGARTVRAATYAFAIWGPIYAGLLVYAVYQFVPRWGADRVLRRFGWPSAVSMLAIGGWLVAAGANWRWMTVALIALAAIVLIVPLMTRADAVGRRDSLLVVTPLALLAGWLTIATGLNTITVLTAEGFVSAGAATVWALGGLLVSVAVAAIVSLRSDVLAYPVPIVWGLIAVFVAERADRAVVAWCALAAAIALASLVASRRLARGRPPAAR
jgi:hypothetical protein